MLYKSTLTPADHPCFGSLIIQGTQQHPKYLCECRCAAPPASSCHILRAGVPQLARLALKLIYVVPIKPLEPRIGARYTILSIKLTLW
jgi:hypothetical protein